MYDTQRANTSGGEYSPPHFSRAFPFSKKCIFCANITRLVGCWLVVDSSADGPRRLPTGKATKQSTKQANLKRRTPRSHPKEPESREQRAESRGHHASALVSVLPRDRRRGRQTQRLQATQTQGPARGTAPRKAEGVILIFPPPPNIPPQKKKRREWGGKNSQ